MFGVGFGFPAEAEVEGALPAEPAAAEVAQDKEHDEDDHDDADDVFHWVGPPARITPRPTAVGIEPETVRLQTIFPVQKGT